VRSGCRAGLTEQQSLPLKQDEAPWPTTVMFVALRRGLKSLQLACMARSLVRVSRRDPHPGLHPKPHRDLGLYYPDSATAAYRLGLAHMRCTRD
jgi:hypothetical protein